jgi:hypothetical protein
VTYCIRDTRPDVAFDADGETEAGRELLGARLAVEGRYLIFELAPGYLAVDAEAEMHSAATVTGLMTTLGIPYTVAPPSAWNDGPCSSFTSSEDDETVCKNCGYNRGSHDPSAR